MFHAIEKLSSWLFSNGFYTESSFALDLLKVAAGKPLKINRAGVEQIVDDLLSEFSARILAMPGFSPYELYGVLAGQAALDDAKIAPLISNPTLHQRMQALSVHGIYSRNLPRDEQVEELEKIVGLYKARDPEKYRDFTVDDLERVYQNSQEQYLVNYLESSVTYKDEKDVKGNEIDVTYKLLFSDNPSKPPGVTATRPDDKEKIVILGFNPNSGLIDRVQDYLQNNQQEYHAAMGNIPREIDFFTKSIRPYLVEVLRHEEVHVRDVIPSDPRHAERYQVSDVNGETIEEIARKLEVNPFSLFMINSIQIIEEANIQLSPQMMMRAITELTSGRPSATNSVFDHIKSKKLRKDFKLLVPPRAQSQIRINEREDAQGGGATTDSLQDIADRIGLKHGAMRLLVVNFNHIFGPRLTMGEGGRPIGTAPSYQHILDHIPDHVKQNLINTPLPAGEEVRIVPSYDELYSYDRSFYLLTREESKAHYEQIIYQIEQATEGFSAQQFGLISVEDMINLSSIAKHYRDALKVNTVDELIKTPIGYLDHLKKERIKTFNQRMYELWLTEIKSKSE
jgi:hypothetical protein